MASQKRINLDNIFNAIGDLKAFSIRQLTIILLSTLPAAYQLLSHVFIAMDVPHRCSAGPNGSVDLLSDVDEYRGGEVDVSYEQCQIVISYNHSVLDRRPCVYGMDFDKPIDTSIISQFGLVCEYASLAKFSQTLVIIGQGVGAIFFTMLSDRYGRRPLLIGCNVGLGVCGFVVAYAPSYVVFAIFKFLVGLFQQGCVAIPVTACIEMLSTRNRRLAALCHGVLWGVAVTSLALWAYLLRDSSWRTLQMALSVSSATFILQIWLMKESPVWLIANGKDKAVLNYLQVATKCNKTSYQQAVNAYRDICSINGAGNGEIDESVDFEKKVARKRLTLLDLLKVKRLLLNAVAIWIGWFTSSLGYFAIYLTSTSLAGNPYLNFFLTSTMEIPNMVVMYYCLNRFGRKFTLVVSFATLSLGVIGGGLFQSIHKTDVTSSLAVVCSCIAMFGASSAFEVLFFYTPEIFPTNMRNQALGVASMIARIGGMIAPFTGILSKKALWAPGVFLGGCSFIVCLATMVLPETKGRPLPQSIDDVMSWFRKAKETEYKEDDKGNGGSGDARLLE